MRDELLSIGEMARLKGVTVKGLRYYERIGVLEPALVDERTGYRYYTLSQSMDVDMITMCTEIGIPLRELKGFRRDDGTYELDGMLELGQRRARENLQRARRLAVQADSYRSGIELQRESLVSMLAGRDFLLLPWNGGGFDARRYVRAATMVYSMAEQLGYIALFLMGMVRLESDGPWSICVEVAQLDGESCERDSSESGGRAASGDTASGTRLYRAPEARYETQRIEGSSYAECFLQALAMPQGAGPLFAFETWEREADPTHVIVDVVFAS